MRMDSAGAGRQRADHWRHQNWSSQGSDRGCRREVDQRRDRGAREALPAAPDSRPRATEAVADGERALGARIMEINGVAHVMLTVSNFDACLPFYEKLLTYLGLKPVIQSDGMFYCVGGRTAVGIARCDDAHRGE